MQAYACVSDAFRCPGDSFLADIFEMFHLDSQTLLLFWLLCGSNLMHD